MNFLHLWFIPLFLVALGFLYLLAPATRRRVAAAALLALISAAGLFAAAIFSRMGLPLDSGLCRIVRGLSHILLALALVNTSAAVAFDLILLGLRLTLAALIQDLILAGAYVAITLTVLSHEGANLTGILATSAVVTAVIAFSLQDTLGNILGGMVLHLENSLSPGDRIRMGVDEGVVREIRWRQTTIETDGGDTVIIPNGTLIKSVVMVLGRRQGRVSPRLMKVDFEADAGRLPTQVIGVVESALREDPPPGVAADPPPDCLLNALTASHASYRARFWLSDLARSEEVASEVRLRAFFALTRAGISLAVPARCLTVAPQAVSLDAELQRRSQALRGVDIFKALSDEEIETLAQRLKPAPFARTEAIARQGGSADWFFLIQEGEAEVRLEEGGRSRSVARLKPGDFAGEMSLMTGEPRSATIVALSDVLAYRLEREDFKDILKKRPEIAVSISATLAQRQGELKTARAALQEDAGRRRLEDARGDLLSRIRRLFALS